MKSKVVSAMAAASLALTAFVSFGITASATAYNASTLHTNYTNNKPNVLVNGDTIKQDGGTTAWTYKSVLKLTHKYANGNVYKASFDTEDGSSATVGSGSSRYKYWKVTSSEKKGYSLNSRYDYIITLTANDPTLTKAPTNKNVTYNGSAQQLVNAGTATNGTVQYSLNNSSWSTSIPTATAAGTYTVYYRVAGNTNYNTLDSASVSATIKKANSTFTTAPAAKALTWTGAAQELVSAGTTTCGTVEYKLGDGEWSTNVPEATAVGEYTVYYRIVGDANHNDLAENSVTVAIQAKAATATYENIGDFARADNASAWAVTVTPGSAAIESIDVKVNGRSSEEGIWSDSTVFSGAIQFGVAVNISADQVESVTAVVDGEDVVTTLVD